MGNVVLIVSWFLVGVVVPIGAEFGPHKDFFATNRPNHQLPTVIVAIVNDDDKKKKKKQRLLIVYPVFSLLQTTALISKLCIWSPYRKDAALRLTQQQQRRRQRQQQQQQHLDDGDNVQ